MTAIRQAQRAAVIAVALAVQAVLFAGVAHAAGVTVTVSGGKLWFDATGNQHNDVKISLAGGVATVDDVVALAPGAGCQHSGGDQTKVTCNAATIEHLNASLGDGNDTLTTTTGWSSNVTGGHGNDWIILGPVTTGLSFNVAFGGPGHDKLVGGPDDDYLIGGPDTDVMIGAGGNDTVSYVGATDNVFADLDAGNADDGPSGDNDTIWDDVENLVGGDGDDHLVGDNGPNRLYGGAGGDRLNGGFGQDTLDGGSGEDKLIGGYGSDVLWGGDGQYDRVSYEGHALGVVADLEGDKDDGTPPGPLVIGEIDQIGADVENLTGGDGDDVLIGNGANNFLHGGLGDDQLFGFGGYDVLDGGAGADVMSGGAGQDEVDYCPTFGCRTAALVVDADGQAGDDGEAGEGDTVGSDIENISGGNGNDKLTGNAANNTIDGGSGADLLYGLAGDDTLSGGDNMDGLYGGAGNDECVDFDKTGTVWVSCETKSPAWLHNSSTTGPG